jgi:hypothetical protein
MPTQPQTSRRSTSKRGVPVADVVEAIELVGLFFATDMNS